VGLLTPLGAGGLRSRVNAYLSRNIAKVAGFRTGVYGPKVESSVRRSFIYQPVEGGVYPFLGRVSTGRLAFA